MVEGLEGIRRTFTFYARTLGVLVLGLAGWTLNRFFDLPEENMKIFGLSVYVEYVSAIIGIVMGIFVAVVSLQVSLFKETLKLFVERDSEECRRVAMGIRMYPWVASPFHASRIGLRAFCGVLGGGCLVLVWITAVHLTDAFPTGSPGGFKAIGVFTLSVLVLVLVVLLRWVKRDVLRVLQLLRRMEAGGN